MRRFLTTVSLHNFKSLLKSDKISDIYAETLFRKEAATTKKATNFLDHSASVMHDLRQPVCQRINGTENPGSYGTIEEHHLRSQIDRANVAISQKIRIETDSEFLTYSHLPKLAFPSSYTFSEFPDVYIVEYFERGISYQEYVHLRTLSLASLQFPFLFLDLRLLLFFFVFLLVPRTG